MTDYVDEAMELIGMAEPRQIVQEISGFVPVFDAILDKYDDHITALVFGRRWQYCRMSDGVCTASLERIAKDLKLSAATIMRHTEKLVEGGNLIDLTPDLRNVPHTYADAGLVVMKSQLTASISQRNTNISQRKATVSESKLIKDLNKDFIKETTTRAATVPNIYTLYEQNIGALTPMMADVLDLAILTYPSEWLSDVIALAVTNNKRNWKYCEAILKRWKVEGKDSGEKPPRSNGKNAPAPVEDDFMERLEAKRKKLKAEVA